MSICPHSRLMVESGGFEPQPHPPKGRVLPLHHTLDIISEFAPSLTVFASHLLKTGFEPASPDFHTGALPLSYISKMAETTFKLL